MNTHLKELIELANDDKAIDSYAPRIEASEKKIAKVQKKMNMIQSEIDGLTTEIEDNEGKVKTFDDQLVLLNDQLTSNAKKLKEISTEKEMKALSLEEDIAKEKITFANEEIERLERINATKKTLLAEAQEKSAVIVADFDTINDEVTKEREDIEKSKSVLFTKREAKSRKLDQKVLSFYEKIRIWAGNTTVVPVKKQACYGCYIKLNDKSYSEIIKADEICNCPHCGRILYIDIITEEV